MIIHEIQVQLGKKEEEIQYLAMQLDYIQTKYRQKKTELSDLKDVHRYNKQEILPYSVTKPERDT